MGQETTNSHALTKRTRFIYFVMAMWVLIGALAAYTGTALTSTAMYFGSLTTCVAAYVWGETRRESKKPTSRVPKSERERLVYVSSALWLALGAVAMFHDAIDLKGGSAFFGVLNGFVASYVVGKTYKGGDGETIIKS